MAVLAKAKIKGTESELLESYINLYSVITKSGRTKGVSIPFSENCKLL